MAQKFPDCDGTGRCKYCGGTGKKLPTYGNEQVKCDRCCGYGRCSRCSGKGEV